MADNYYSSGGVMKRQNPVTQLIKSVGVILVLVLLIKCFSGAGDMGPDSTPDPSLMTIEERTIWDLENYRNEMHDLAELAADTPVEDLEPIILQMNALIQDPNKNPEVPPIAAKAQSALREYTWYTKQCYADKYAEYLGETTYQESMGGSKDLCEQAQVFEESFDLYLQELKEMNAEK